MFIVFFVGAVLAAYSAIEIDAKATTIFQQLLASTLNVGAGVSFLGGVIDIWFWIIRGRLVRIEDRLAALPKVVAGRVADEFDDRR